MTPRRPRPVQDRQDGVMSPHRTVTEIANPIGIVGESGGVAPAMPVGMQRVEATETGVTRAA